MSITDYTIGHQLFSFISYFYCITRKNIFTW